MSAESLPKVKDCTCLAVRQAARHVTQFYDRLLAPTGLRTTQHSVLRKLSLRGPMTINALAEEMVMDRTTLGRNVLPLEREGLIAIKANERDRRSKELHLTQAGEERLKVAYGCWVRAQTQFDAAFGSQRAAELRAILNAVSATELDIAAPTQVKGARP